jgi:hypothetical protein
MDGGDQYSKRKNHAKIPVMPCVRIGWINEK